MIAQDIVEGINQYDPEPSRVLISPEFMHLLLASEGLHPPGPGERVYVSGVPLEISNDTETFKLVWE